MFTRWMSTPITGSSCLEMGRQACPFIPSAPSTGSTAASLTLSARLPKAVAAFSPVSSALTDGDTPASALAEAPETTPDICAPTVASSCALTWSKYPVPDDIVYSCF
ncbi:hypothetical protein [Bacteroides finegoldii]|uniref:hypothetical protein n=1 Tax=Bacteroides finegoldii TaxID=338188 RepID=UPI00243099D8|nr:hypothetical protein [Bacteroides finegoldii]